MFFTSHLGVETQPSTQMVMTGGCSNLLYVLSLNVTNLRDDLGYPLAGKVTVCY